MKRLEKLTPKQEAMLPVIRQKWINRLNSLPETNEAEAVNFVNYIYELSNLKIPQVVFVDSPRQAIELVRLSTNNSDSGEFSYYGNIGDYGWVSFYDYFRQIGVIKNDAFNKYADLLFNSAVYDIMTYANVCIVVRMPVFLTRGVNERLHNSKRTAISWKDGYGLYFWNGVSVPASWIEQPDKITKGDVMNEKNAEKRRCLFEIVGAERFASIIGVEPIDEDIDNQGNRQVLYRTKKKDELAEAHIHFARVICPSTKREYFLCVPETITNVWDAVAYTFKKTADNYRPAIET